MTQESRPDGKDLELLYDKLDKLIQEYVKTTIDLQNLSGGGDYVSSWVLVVNYGDLDDNDGVAGEYFVEYMPAKNPEDTSEWVTKVRRNGGGTSILDIATTKEKAQVLADEFNAKYQTDNYYIEPYKEELHAHSRHG